MVIGGGLCASLAALELVRAKKKVVVVSAGPEDGDEPCLGHVPSGPPLPYVDAVRRWGHAAARDLWELQREAQAELRQLARELREEAGWREAGTSRWRSTAPRGTALATGEDMLREDGFAGEFLDGYMLEARFDVRALSAGYWAEAGCGNGPRTTGRRHRRGRAGGRGDVRTVSRGGRAVHRGRGCADRRRQHGPRAGGDPHQRGGGGRPGAVLRRPPRDRRLAGVASPRRRGVFDPLPGSAGRPARGLDRASGGFCGSARSARIPRRWLRRT